MLPGASSIRTLPQSASISSATMAARPLAAPWPNSMCLEIAVTTPSAPMRTKGPKAPKSVFGVPSAISWAGEQAVSLQADSEERVKAALEVFKEKLIKRGISLKALDAGEPQASGKTYRVSASIKQGIETDQARSIAKRIRDQGPKGVQAQIQGDQLRVSAKKKDDLQAVIRLLKEADLDVPLQFTNYR